MGHQRGPEGVNGTLVGPLEGKCSLQKKLEDSKCSLLFSNWKSFDRQLLLSFDFLILEETSPQGSLCGSVGGDSNS